ncbi:hypothetical protein PVAND_006467 [Polypedilum vanderplanki]|uniref:Spaetzle domain-containing protein n=1 Tax=Polypedilum vanderplanki TaxID=319348 RepID=A0A9J6C457_POLVA|nr:hypothetical protein PVAND_006467 [Polypedilum vanderplanki]
MFTRGYLLVILVLTKYADCGVVVPVDSNVLSSTSEESIVAENCNDIAFKLNKPSSSDDDYESIPLCKSSMMKINPNDLIRSRGHDIEDNDKFSQVIEVNVCDNVGASCIFISLLSDIAKSIPCDFTYKEADPNFINELERLDLDLDLENNASSQWLSMESFSCEENDLNNVTHPSHHNHQHHRRFSRPMVEESQESHEYEDIESSCQVRRRTIQPKALNNIYNQLTKVVNTESFVQSINIEECINTKESCNNFIIPPHGKKYICRQKFVRITLKALSERNVVFDDMFYYPSHCLCELVTVKKKTKKPKRGRRCFVINT